MQDSINPSKIHATTILCVRKGGKVAIAGDGQVSFGNTVMKNTARKVRKLYSDKIVSGFAGSAADAFTLFELFEKKYMNSEEVFPDPRSNLPENGDPTERFED